MNHHTVAGISCAADILGNKPSPEVSHSSCSSGHDSPAIYQRSGAHHLEFPVRKVYSAGDLQGMDVNVMHNYNGGSERGMWSESSMIIEGMRRAHPYSPEEKKMRIERYRFKRHKRNFNKTIQYVCRKTLADSRPRIRGRFAKSEDSEIKSEKRDDINWDTFFETLVVANLVHQP